MANVENTFDNALVSKELDIPELTTASVLFSWRKNYLTKSLPKTQLKMEAPPNVMQIWKWNRNDGYVMGGNNIDIFRTYFFSFKIVQQNYSLICIFLNFKEHYFRIAFVVPSIFV